MLDGTKLTALAVLEVGAISLVCGLTGYAWFGVLTAVGVAATFVVVDMIENRLSGNGREQR